MKAKDKKRLLKDIIKTFKCIKKEAKLSKRYMDNLQITRKYSGDVLNLRITEGWSQNV